MRILTVTAFYFCLVSADARMGETPIQFVERYGAPKDSSATKIMDSHSPWSKVWSITPASIKAGRPRRHSCNSTGQRSGWSTKFRFLHQAGIRMKVSGVTDPDGNPVLADQSV